MRTLLFPMLIAIFLVSCKKEDQPVKLKCSFTVEDDLLKIGEPVVIDSINVDNSLYCSWDFGDGFRSNKRKPFHAFSSAGNHIITLTVNDKSGNLSSYEQSVKVGEIFVYELIVTDLNSHNWANDNNVWDMDSTGNQSLPDIFFRINAFGGTTLFESKTIYNMTNDKLPFSFSVPEIKISNISGLGDGIWLNDRDSNSDELIVSNQMSGREQSSSYDKKSHEGVYKVRLFDNSFTMKYRVK